MPGPDLTAIVPLPRYRCHKIVAAVKILSLLPIDDGGAVLHVGPDIPSIVVPAEYCQKHQPVVGGYFVRYEDGYASFSPADAFEAGYTRIPTATFESPEPMLQFFTYEHLPTVLQAVSLPFCHLAYQVVVDLPRNPERTVALRKLLEAKDCAVRAVLYRS